jgi:hypothetical protein
MSVLVTNSLKRSASHSNRNLQNWTPITYCRLGSSVGFWTHWLRIGNNIYIYIYIYVYTCIFFRSRYLIHRGRNFERKNGLIYLLSELEHSMVLLSRDRFAVGDFGCFTAVICSISKILSVIHFYVRGGNTSFTYYESHNSGKYLRRKVMK